MELGLDRMYPNPNQPRKNFDPAKLRDLADSIREQGLLDPIVAVKRDTGYMIVAGERRYRASLLAGLKKVQVRLIEADDKKVAEPARIFLESGLDLAGRELAVQTAISAPDEVRRSRIDPRVYLFCKLDSPRRWICAVAKQVDGEGFLITTYPTDVIKEGERI